MSDRSLYDVLGIETDAQELQIRRAYRNLFTRKHLDKGEDADEFNRITVAYDVLSDSQKKAVYDKTGQVQLSVEEQLRQNFVKGNFKDAGAQSASRTASLSDQITVRQTPVEQSHTAGFDAWMRARGDAPGSTFTADTIADKYGVVKGSYTSIALPATEVYQVKCNNAGPANESCELVSGHLPATLEWGEVLVSMQYAPINPADVYTVRTGGVYGEEQVKSPFYAGHDGIGFVSKVGDGVKSLAEGDWVVPAATHVGTWRNLAVWKEADLLKVTKELMPLEHAAMLRELCLAYRLLEDHGNLKMSYSPSAPGSIGCISRQHC